MLSPREGPGEPGRTTTYGPFDSCVIFQGGQFDVAAIVESKTEKVLIFWFLSSHLYKSDFEAGSGF